MAANNRPRSRARAGGSRARWPVFVTVFALTASAFAPGPRAFAQDTRRPESGYIGGSTGTEELDDCRVEQDLGERVRIERSSEHYDRGTNLFAQGDYRAAIEEFKLSYCHYPHPSTLKGIAEAYERLVDYEKAVAYLERFIMENPPEKHAERRSKAAYVEVLRNLPAHVSIATEPPGASVTLTGETGASARGVANADEPLEVRKGTYQMTIEKPGFETIEKTIEVKIGKPYSYYYQLQPKRGTLRVVTVPATASIFIDERRVALGTYVDQLPVGTYTITAEADGRVAETRQVEITDGSNANVSIELAKKPRSGRLDLLLFATLGGAWAGSSIAALLSDRGEALGGAVPVGIGVGFGGAYLGVPDRIPVGTSSYIIGATIAGAFEGGLLSSHFYCDDSGACDQQLLIASSLAGGVTGLLASALSADLLRLDPGDAALINSGALWGTASGTLFWVVFDRDQRLAAPLALAGLNLGILTGALLARRAQVSRRHVALIDVSGALGLVVGGAIADVADQGEGISERIPHFALLGMTVGLIAGTYLTRNLDEPPSLRVVAPTVSALRDADGKQTMTMGMHMVF